LNQQEVVLAKQLSLIRRLDALIYREISGLGDRLVRAFPGTTFDDGVVPFRVKKRVE
jgi:hypothetical protein